MGDIPSPLGPIPIQKSKPSLLVKLTGGGVSPERVPLGVLARTLDAIQSLTSDDQTQTAASPDFFHLVRVRKGSAIYAFGGTPKADTYERLRVVGRALVDPSSAPAFDFSLRALSDLSAIAARLDCQIVIARPTTDKAQILARIGPNSAKQLKDALLIHGDTSIYGEVKRVGGVKEMRCSVRLPSQNRLLYCRVQGAKLSRQLGKHLYQNVVLHGRATWMRSNWRIVRFVVSGVECPEQGKLSDAFEEIREAGGKDWDQIQNPDEFLGIDRSEEWLL